MDINEICQENSELKEQLKILKKQLAAKSEQLESLRSIFYEITGSVPSKSAIASK